jgi:hypothetical protein
MAIQLHILDISKNAGTGLITMEAMVIDNGVAGVVERFHVESLEIANVYGGDSERWIRHKGREMIDRHKLRVAAHDDINKWKGQKIEIADI